MTHRWVGRADTDLLLLTVCHEVQNSQNWPWNVSNTISGKLPLKDKIADVMLTSAVKINLKIITVTPLLAVDREIPGVRRR